MKIKLIACGLILAFLAAATTAPVPAFAQTPSSFSFSFPGSSLVTCWFYGLGFDATQGQQVTVKWSENPLPGGPISLDFYIVPLASLHQIWLCEDGPVYLYWNDGAFGTVNWSAPSASGYAVLLVNYSYYPVSGRISVTGINFTLSASPIGPSTVRRHYCVGANCEGS
jgi:hypothetical protein